MKRKTIWYIIATVIVVLGAAFMYLNYRNRSLSPPGSAEITAGDLTVSVTYSRPSVRGRLIFGTEEQKALQPYGKYWRLGANEATEMTVNKNVTFNGEPLKPGSYRMYAVPGPDQFELVINTQTGEWGAFEPDTKFDLFRTKVPVEKINPPVEQYTISLKDSGSGVDVVFEWSDVRFVVPVKPQ